MTDAVEPADTPIALDGRAVGRRGQKTRRLLLDATASLLETHGVRDLRVVEIARAVGTSPATFYQYFRDVEEAVLALAERVGDELAPLLELLDAPWDDDAGLDAARGLVAGFLEYWDRHRAVLRTRNLAAQEGDARFREVRNHSLEPFLGGFATKIASAQAAGSVAVELTPRAAAAALVALLERMAAFHHDLELLGVERDDLVETTARIVHQTVTGR
ncbi:MAG TPA: TetR family transcriptional regulator [Acidimicrobiia bacterium]|nr:TetR family transcriptional regulator [Acidimicrobiia bacterium]